MSGAYTLRALVASHAKPWKESTDVEKPKRAPGEPVEAAIWTSSVPARIPHIA